MKRSQILGLQRISNISRFSMKFFDLKIVHTGTKLLSEDYICVLWFFYERMLLREGYSFCKAFENALESQGLCKALETLIFTLKKYCAKWAHMYMVWKPHLKTQIVKYIFTMNVFWELVVSLRFLLRMDGIDLPLVDSIWWCENSNIRASSILWHLFCGNFLLCQVTLGARYCCQSVSSWFVAFNSSKKP